MNSNLFPEEDRQASHLLHSLPGIVFGRDCDRDRTMRFLSDGCFVLTEYLPSELSLQSETNTSYNSIIYPEDWIELLARLDLALEKRQSYSAEYRIQTKSGAQKWFLEQGYIARSPTANSPTASSPGTIEGLIIDISEQKQAQVQLQQDAFYDKLTGLPNRSLFIDRLTQSVRRIQRTSTSQFAVLFLDLDRFKVINDSLGHRAGDQLLVQVAQRLQGCIRPGDTVARLGGDEFTMLIDDIHDLQDVTQVSERILNDMSLPFQIEDQEIFTTTSIGIALSATGYGYPEDLIRDADIALYQAKALGKARYALFQPGMHIHAVARLQIENDLRHAIQRTEFCLLYQPIISMETGQLVGMEAFVYWNHPTRGLLAPGEFLPVAEETGLMIAIGQWSIRQACTQIQQWHQQFPLSQSMFISLNLSSTEIAHPELMTFLQALLQSTGLEPLSLKLEISESTLMDHSNRDAVLAQIHQLQEIGIQLCIDDFGTGYASLSSLDQFPIDFLKVDRSFIARVDAAESLEIVRTIVNLAQNLGIKAIAEGIETTAQLAQLRALNCEYGQGYAFSRPLDALQMIHYLEKQFSGEAYTSITVSLPRLVIHTHSGCYQLLLLGRTSWSLGRSQESTIFLADRMVSREHAIIVQLAHSNDFYLVDLGSRNGSFVNHQRVKVPTPLRNGDLVRIGKTELEYYAAAAAAVPTHELPWSCPQTILMHQPSKLQGQIWREVLIAQAVSIIWQASDVSLVQTLSQIESSGEPIPDLLLLDVDSIRPNIPEFFNWLRLRYETLPVILTDGATAEVSPVQRQQAIQSGALDLLPGFRLRGTDLMTNSTDVTGKVIQVLQALSGNPPDADAVMKAAGSALQNIIRNETLY